MKYSIFWICASIGLIAAFVKPSFSAERAWQPHNLANVTRSENETIGYEQSLLVRHYVFIPTHGYPIVDSEALYKTLVYAYGYARFVWRQSGLDREGRFTPPAIYGLEIGAVSRNRTPIDPVLMSWVLWEISLSMHKNLYLSLSAVVLVSSELLLTVRVVPSRALLNSSVAIDKRGSSPHSFERSITTKIEARGPFIVSGVESVLMLTLVNLTRMCYDKNVALHYEAQSPDGEIRAAVFPAGGSSTVWGPEVIDASIDLIEWVYQKRHSKGLFPVSEVEISRTDGQRTRGRLTAKLSLGPGT